MQFTTSALTLLTAAAMVQASCVPIITCGMKRDVSHPHTPVTAAGSSGPSGNDFGNAFAACLNKDHAEITSAGGNAFSIHGKAGAPAAFHDCDALVKVYQADGMKHGPLKANADGSFQFTPTAQDLPTWQAAIKGGAKATRDFDEAFEAEE